MGIFNQVRAARVPAQHPAMQLVLRMEAVPAELGREHKIEIRCMDADGDDVFRIEGGGLLLNRILLADLSDLGQAVEERI
jgi:hypothetical protein